MRIFLVTPLLRRWLVGRRSNLKSLNPCLHLHPPFALAPILSLLVQVQEKEKEEEKD